MVTPRPVHLGSDARNGRPTPLPHCDNKSLVWSTSDVRVFTSQRQNASDPPRVSECLPPRYKMRLIRLGCPSVYLPETKCVWSASGVRAFTSQRQNASDPPRVSERLPPRDKMRLIRLGCPSVYLPETRCVWCTSGVRVFTSQRQDASDAPRVSECLPSRDTARAFASQKQDAFDPPRVSDSSTNQIAASEIPWQRLTISGFILFVLGSWKVLIYSISLQYSPKKQVALEIELTRSEGIQKRVSLLLQLWSTIVTASGNNFGTIYWLTSDPRSGVGGICLEL